MPLSPDELEPLLRLALVQGVGPQRLGRLLERFGSAERVLSSRPRELLQMPGVGPELAGRILGRGGAESRRRARTALAEMKRVGACALVPTDPSYPPSFTRLPDPPFLVFAGGDLSALERPALAVVGTRDPTPYGKRVARELSADLVLEGYAIVSGMARGIDSSAHLGALDAGGVPIGVLGHGIEQVYPTENRELFRRVREQGLLLTEYPPGETPKAGNFPRRNRLITAMSEAVLVVEMGHQSGAQHTVTYALEQGREVLAVPGPIGSTASAGTNQLIRDGAPLVTCVADVMDELRGVGPVPPRSLHPHPHLLPSLPGRSDPSSRPSLSLPLLTEGEERVMRHLSPEPRHVDELAAEASLATSIALAVLLELELRGLAVSLPGKRYVRS